MASPYPWHYSLRWPWYFRFPSTVNHTGMGQLPIAQALSGEGPYCRLVFGGDIMVMQRDAVPLLHENLVRLLRSADLVVMNCEAPVGTHSPSCSARYRFNFHMPQAFLEGVIQQVTSFPTNWILSVANNHAGDRGYAAFLQSLHILQEMRIRTVGRWRAIEDVVRTVEVKGLRLGYAAWTNWLNCAVFQRDDEGVNRTKDIAELDWREEKAKRGLDVLIGLPHWEYEFQHFPSSATRLWAKKLSNRGFDMLIGAHPHTLQPMERFGAALCQYSLGNFCGLGVAWSAKLIPLLEVSLWTEGPKKGRIAAYRLHPFVQRHDHKSKSVSIVPLERYYVKDYGRLRKRLASLFGPEARDDPCPSPRSPQQQAPLGVGAVRPAG